MYAQSLPIPLNPIACIRAIASLVFMKLMRRSYIARGFDLENLSAASVNFIGCRVRSLVTYGKYEISLPRRKFPRQRARYCVDFLFSLCTVDAKIVKALFARAQKGHRSFAGTFTRCIRGSTPLFCGSRATDPVRVRRNYFEREREVSS